MKKKRKKILIIALTVAAVLIAVTVTCDQIVKHNAQGRTYRDVTEIPHRQTGLLLGTSPFWGDHRRNIYFENRIRAAADLYSNGKIDRIIASGGDNSAEGGYDEPRAMRDSLVAHGVAPAHIIMDYDGQRTMKSIENVRNKYHTDSITIISQHYHNERALYQADHAGVDAIAYDATTPRRLLKLIKNRGREYFARVKLFIDLAF